MLHRLPAAGLTASAGREPAGAAQAAKKLALELGLRLEGSVQAPEVRARTETLELALRQAAALEGEPQALVPQRGPVGRPEAALVAEQVRDSLREWMELGQEFDFALHLGEVELEPGLNEPGRLAVVQQQALVPEAELVSVPQDFGLSDLALLGSCSFVSFLSVS